MNHFHHTVDTFDNCAPAETAEAMTEKNTEITGVDNVPKNESISVFWAARRLCELKTPAVSFDDYECSFASSSFESGSFSSRPSFSAPPFSESEHLTESSMEMKQMQMPPIKPFTNSNTSSPIDDEEIAFSLRDYDDEDNVNQLHQFVRRDLVEVYIIPKNKRIASANLQDDDGADMLDEAEVCGLVGADSFDSTASSLRTSSRPSNIPNAKQQVKQRAYPGRVGLRCKYCRQAGALSSSTVKMATVLPLSVKNLYRAVCRFQTTHFLKCPNVPRDERAKYMTLKESDKTRGNKKYWITSALRKGLMDHPDGIEGIILDEEKFRRRVGYCSF
mmetsp:Transcript_6424/g.13419  ORF Transcript_6424/g.13419 Transcript_6424/m.13419 type:complete len:332 (+) Transcript_6424:133-1128(+)